MESFKKHSAFFGRKKTKEVTTFILVTLTAFFLAEFTLRSLTSFERAYVDPLLGTPPKVGIDTDANGFYNDAVLTNANIVTLGNSVTTGFTATRPESWPQVLAKLATTSVYNMAMPAAGPVQYAAELNQALTLRPKVVVVGFIFGIDIQKSYEAVYENELWKDLRDPAFISAHMFTTDGGCKTSPGLGVAQLRCRLVKLNAWLNANVLIYRTSFTGKKASDTSISVSDQNIGTILSPDEFWEITRMDPIIPEGWRITKELFADMKRKAARQGVRFVVLIIPHKEEVYAEYYRVKGVEVPRGLLPYATAVARVHTEIQQYCSEQHVECVDALPDLVSALLKGKRVFADSAEDHPLSGGYAVIGETVASYLRK